MIRMSIDVDDELLADIMRRLPEMSTEEVIDHALRRLIYPRLVSQPVLRA
ncbi:type II toxin-antitoxin system VapB family antitoxin [Microtetraspora malaysiensis]